MTTTSNAPRIDHRDPPAPSCAGLRTLVTGATGFIGGHLLRALLDDGATVRALVRDAAKARRLPPDVHRCFGTLSDPDLPDALPALADDIDAVFHLGAATRGDWREHERSTVEGTRRLLQLCHDAGVKRFIHISSLAAHDTTRLRDGDTVTPDSPLAPPDTDLGSYAKGKAQAERIVLEFCDRTGLPFTIVRPGIVYGPGHISFEHLGRNIRGTFLAPGKPDQLLPLVSIDSVTDALLRIATSPDAAGKAYLLVDEDLPRDRYIALLAEATGQQLRHTCLPPGLARAAAATLHKAKRTTGLKKIPDTTVAKVHARTLSLRHDCRSLREDTRWQPPTSLAEQLRRALDATPAPRPDRLRVGIIGAGAIARMHIASLQTIANAELIGILDTAPGRAAELAATVTGARCTAYDDPDAFYAAAAPDAVHILTPPATHCDAAVAALERGIHVLCEKPLALTVAECRRMTDAARASGVLLAVNHNYLLDARFARAKHMIESGAIGELRHIDIFWAFDLKRLKHFTADLASRTHWAHTLPGGMLEDLAPHPLSIAVALLGDQTRTAHAAVTGAGRIADGIDEELRIALESPVATANLALSLTARPDDFTVTLYGTRATIRLDLQDMLLHHLRLGKGPKAVARGLKAGRANLQSLAQLALNPAKLATHRALPPADPRPLLAAFYQSLATGAAPPTPAEQGAKVVELIRDIWPA